MRARPKILLCSNYEEAWDYYEKYGEFILWRISDIDFSRNGVEDKKAGILFARNVKKGHPDIPGVLLLSNMSENDEEEQKMPRFFCNETITLIAANG